MTGIPFVSLHAAQYGEVVQVAPLVQRVIAENPSKFTSLGTGTYIIGHESPGSTVAVIDPGPLADGHRAALTAALAGREVTAILITHCHADHSPLAAWLRAASGAPTFGFGPHPRPDPADLIDDDSDCDSDSDSDTNTGGSAPAKIEETTDHDFEPDHRLGDGAIAATGPGWTLRSVHTPGHTSNHLCYALDEQQALFTGDHIMGWSTTVIGPPDGDMRAYFDSLRKVQGRADAVFYPTHGAPVTDPAPFLDAFLAHRLAREADVLTVVRSGTSAIREIVSVLYANVRRELHRPARRSVLAHLVKLVDDGLVTVGGGGPARLGSVYLPA